MHILFLLSYVSWLFSFLAIYTKEDYFIYIKFIWIWLNMGCNTSEPNVAGSVDFANRSPSQDCINDDKKTKLKKIIQKDNHTELALFLADKCKIL